MILNRQYINSYSWVKIVTLNSNMDFMSNIMLIKYMAMELVWWFSAFLWSRKDGGSIPHLATFMVITTTGIKVYCSFKWIAEPPDFSARVTPSDNLITFLGSNMVARWRFLRTVGRGRSASSSSKRFVLLAPCTALQWDFPFWANSSTVEQCTYP